MLTKDDEMKSDGEVLTEDAQGGFESVQNCFKLC